MLFFVFQLKNSIFVKDIDDELTSFFEVESFFEEVKHDEAMAAFKTLMNSNNLAESCQKAHAFIQLLRLGKIEEGSVSSAARFKSLNARWFGVKEVKKSQSEESCGNEMVYIHRNSLIKMKYKRGGTETVLYYQVMCIFSKNYNKWFVHLDDTKVPFVPGSKQYKFLVRLMKFAGPNTYEEVKLEKTGEWSPKAVFRIAFMAEILSVENELENGWDDDVEAWKED